MAGDWIKVQTCTPDKPEVHQLAESLGIDPDAVVGKLLRIWVWADQQTIDGNARSVTKSLLDRVTSVSGFADAMLNVGWLTKTEAGFAFPNFDRHNGQTAKKRATGAKRVENHRKTGAVKASTECNARSVTEALPEKRREEKSNSIGGRAPENRIPDSLNDNQCIAAAEKWFDYLDSKQLHDKSPRGNEIALEAWWGQMAKFGRDGFLEAVEFSMSRGKWNVEIQEHQGGRARKTEPKEWIEAVKAAKKFPDNWERRKQILDPDVFEALKLTGSKSVAFGNDFELKTLKELFESHLKDIRSGITTGN
jgi:hypothetical protein